MPREISVVRQRGHHVLDWFVEEDNVADWEPTGPRFEVTSGIDGQGEVAEL